MRRTLVVQPESRRCKRPSWLSHTVDSGLPRGTKRLSAIGGERLCPMLSCVVFATFHTLRVTERAGEESRYQTAIGNTDRKS